MAAPIQEQHVEVRYNPLDKGRGLFACHNIAMGDILVKEHPLVSAQFSWNALYNYVACDFCLKSLESAEGMCQRLSAKPTLQLPYPGNDSNNPLEHTRCPHCQVLYCSAECREKAWHQFHMTLCLGPAPGPEHPLLKLQEAWRNIHFPPETANVMLIARMMATVRQGSDKQAAIAAFKDFCRATVNEEEEIAHKLLGSQFEEQIASIRVLINQALYNEEIQEWFTPEGFKSLIAMIGRNGQGIGTSSLSVWVHACDAMELEEEDRKRLDEYIDQIYVDIEKEAGSFLNCEGSGLYTLQSACNHSCTPNAEITFPYNNSTLEIRTLMDIAEGEEIFISYLDDCQLERSRHSRQKALRENYLFNCNCRKCLEQGDDPDETSEEEEDMDEDLEP